MIRELIALCRPQQWVKNTFVLAPLVFSGRLSTPAVIWSECIAFFCFCLASSSVYCINDVVDAGADRSHPRKKQRPIAAGKVTPAAGLITGSFLAIGAVLIAAFTVPAILPFVGIYLANSLAYVFVLKHKVIVDVLSIAAGFVIRILAGCASIQVEPSSWILVCGFSLAMLLGFGKRRLEVNQGHTVAFRRSLESYDAPKLNTLLGVTSSICLMSYMLFTIAPETAALHHTRGLIFTVPFVAYGVFRYLFKVQEVHDDGPIELLLDDYIFIATGLLWLLACLAIIYYPHYSFFK